MKIGEDLHFLSCPSPVVLALVISNIREIGDLNFYWSLTEKKFQEKLVRQVIKLEWP